METNNDEPKTQSIIQNKEDLFSNKNAVIVFLTILLIFSFLGINIIKNIGDLLQHILNTILYFIRPLLSDVTFITGSAIDSTGDLVADASKTGIDIAEGTVHSIGDLLKGSNTSNIEFKSMQLDNSINKSTIYNKEPKHDNASNPIQNPITSKKSSWCLVGEYQGRRGCIEISEHDKCLSGQVFPEQKMCLNPTFTPNK
jgi:hypothetical protein